MLSSSKIVKNLWILDSKEGTEEAVYTKQKMYRTKKDQIQLR